MSGVWVHMAATRTKMQRLALDPATKPLTFLCFSTFAPPTYLAPTTSCAANTRNKEGLSADTTSMSEERDVVLDRDVSLQSHVSAHLSSSGRALVSSV